MSKRRIHKNRCHAMRGTVAATVMCGLLIVGLTGCAVQTGAPAETQAGTEGSLEIPEDAPAWQRLATTEEDITFDWYINPELFTTVS